MPGLARNGSGLISSVMNFDETLRLDLKGAILFHYFRHDAQPRTPEDPTGSKLANKVLGPKDS